MAEPTGSSNPKETSDPKRPETSEPAQLRRTVLYDLHQQWGAKFVEFAGYEMPVQYALGVMGEHKHCRAKAGLFDVSHMGQAHLKGPDHETVANALEVLLPSNIRGLKPERMRYTVLLNKQGGIEDDLMVTCLPEGAEAHYGLVVNAARKTHDFDLLRQNLPESISLEILEDHALLALQGPMAEMIIAIWCGEAVGIPFMSSIKTTFFGLECQVSRCGYTGEDGYEISAKNEDAVKIATMILSHDDVMPIGLGARDSLRLEAGLCLYGHDMDEETSPVEADLSWIISKRRREQGGFLGEDLILSELEAGPKKIRIGLLPEGRAPAREGAKIYNADDIEIGIVTSGGFGPSLERPVAMGYVLPEYGQLGTTLYIDIRGKKQKWITTDMPFVPHRYFSAKSKAPTTH